MQGYLPLVQDLAAGYLVTTQSAGTANSHPFGSSLHGAEKRLLHCSTEGNPVLHLVSYRASHQKGVELRLLNLLNIELHLLTENILQVRSHLVNSLSAASDDYTGAGGIDGHRHLICLAVNLDQRDTGFGISGINRLPDFQVLL